MVKPAASPVIVKAPAPKPKTPSPVEVKKVEKTETVSQAPAVPQETPRSATPEKGDFITFDNRPPSPEKDLDLPELRERDKGDPHASVTTVEIQLRRQIQGMDMPLSETFKILCGDGAQITGESLRSFLKSKDIEISEEEGEAMISEYDTNQSESLFMIEFQRMVVALLGQQFVDRINRKHLSVIKTDGYTNQEMRLMKCLEETFTKDKLPFSKLWIKLLRYSPDGMLDTKSFQSALAKEYDINVKESDLDKLCRKFDDSKDNEFKGLSRASFTKLLSIARAL